MSYSPADFPEDEAFRQQSLLDLHVLDTAPEEEFDALVKAASLVAGTPISLISLVDAERQWFKANVGLGATQTPRDVAFCSHAILGSEVFEVEDTLQDQRFAGNPLVLDAPNIRFYAGAPITLSNGARVGTLCAIDRIPRKLSPTQKEVLRNLAISAARALDMRRDLLSERSKAIDSARADEIAKATAIRQKLEAALIQANALHATIDIHAIVTETDRYGVITSCNDQFERISGYSREELIGQNHRIVNSGYHPEAFWSQMWETIASGTPWRGDICNRSKNGQLYWVDSMIAPFIGDDGFVEKYISIRTDITERVLGQQKLDEMSLRLNLAAEGGHDGLWDWPDIDLDAQWWSPSYYTMLGYTDAELPASRTSFLSLVHPSFSQLCQTALQEAIDDNKPVDIEVQLKTKAQGYRWFRVRAKAGQTNNGHIRMSGATKDIHDRKAAEAALLANKVLLDESQAIAKVGGWELNLLTGNLFWTDETYRIHETSPSEFNPTVDAGVGYFLPESKRIISEALEAAMTRGEGYDLELETYTTRGSLIEVRTTCTVTMEAGKPIKLTGIFQDITEHKRQERALREARDAAQAASQSKGQFLANMSHEIRTPMNGILGLLEILKSTELTDIQRDYVTKTDGAARSLLGLLNDILDFSKVEAGKLTLESEPIQIDDFFRNVATLLSGYVGYKPIEVLFDLDPQAPKAINSDALRLQQVLINLAGNAIKFTATGEVVISLRLVGIDARTATLEFAVKDTGIGISPEHQEHIFTGFSQAEASTTRRFGGTGLGLAISKRLVELMGGALQLESTPGVGSTFSFSIPVPILEPATPPIDVMPKRSARAVLVVDDNAVARELTVQMLQSQGWSTHAVASGDEAVGDINSTPDVGTSAVPYAAILMDTRMTGADSWQVVRRLRETLTQRQLVLPPFIMVAPNERESVFDRTEYELSLISGFVVKPFTAIQISQVIDAAASGGRPLRQTSKSAIAGRPLAGMRILVVEDNLINQQVAEQLLSAAGASVSLAANGQLGVEAVAKAAPPFDVVLMDIQMPVLDGYGATAAIREDLKLVSLPIVAMTANAMASDREACLAAGMSEHIGKPFDMKKLVSLLISVTGLPHGHEDPEIESTSTNETSVGIRIEGLDLDGALARMAGMKSLYVRTATGFYKSFDSWLQELEQRLDLGDTKAVQMQLHTLKGNAGTLGLSDLAGFVRKLETLCKLHGVTACKERMNELGQHLQVAKGKLEQAIPKLLPQFGPTRNHSAVPLDSAEILKNLEQLETLARAADLTVLQRFAESSDALAGLPDDLFNKLEDAFQALNLEAALKVCSEVRARLLRA